MLVLNGDCLELMKTLPSKSVDLFICDLPFGCLDIAWDVKLDLEKFWEQIERLMKNEHTPILHFCNTRFGNELINSKPKWFRYDLVWNKGDKPVGFLNANKQPLRSHENIYVFSKKGANYNRIDIEGVYKGSARGYHRPSSACDETQSVYKRNTGVRNPTSSTHRCVKSVIEFSPTKDASKRHHPTEKPIELYKFLIERYSNQGDLVLDPTFGSGNSGRACFDLKRDYVGIEKDEKYFNAFFNGVESNAVSTPEGVCDGAQEVNTPVEEGDSGSA